MELEELETKPLEVKFHKNELGQLIFENKDEWLKQLNGVENILRGLSVSQFNYKEAKKVRAMLNNTGKTLVHIKTSFIKDYVGEYEKDTREITKKIDKLSVLVDKKIKFYEDENGIIKQKTNTIIIKTKNDETVLKIKEFIEQLEDCLIEIK